MIYAHSANHLFWSICREKLGKCQLSTPVSGGKRKIVPTLSPKNNLIHLLTKLTPIKHMKKSVIVIALLFVSTFTFAQWTLDKGHSKATFIAEHHGISEVDGYFKKMDGKITASKDDLSDAVFELTIETPSINTDLEMRDNHLKSEDMFNVEKYPTMTFKSTGLQKVGGNKYKMTGDLTIKGITKPITLDVTMNGPAAHPNPANKKLQLGVKALGTVKRSDYGIGGKLATVMVGDEISLRATGEFQKN